MKIVTPAAFDVNQTCHYIGISRATLYRLVKTGELRLTKVGGKSLIRRVDADALLERGLLPLSDHEKSPETLGIFG